MHYRDPLHTLKYDRSFRIEFLFIPYCFDLVPDVSASIKLHWLLWSDSFRSWKSLSRNYKNNCMEFCLMCTVLNTLFCESAFVAMQCLHILNAVQLSAKHETTQVIGTDYGKAIFGFPRTMNSTPCSSLKHQHWIKQTYTRDFSLQFLHVINERLQDSIHSISWDKGRFH